MALRKVFGVFTILCLLILTGIIISASATQEAPQPAPEIEMADPAALRLALGDTLEYQLPMDTMEVIGRYNVTIDPTESFTVEPLNLGTPLEVSRNTPIGALDAVASSGELNYTTYYNTTRGRSGGLLGVGSIDEYVSGEDRVWFTLYDVNESFYGTGPNTQTHNLSDGETIWFIYCDLSDFDSSYESPTDRAVAGIAITVTYGAAAPPGYQTPTQTMPIYQPPTQTMPIYQPPTQTMPIYQPPTQTPPMYQPPTQTPPMYQPPTQTMPIYQPPTQAGADLTITPEDIAGLQWQEAPGMPGWLMATDPARGLTFYMDQNNPDLIVIITPSGEWYGYQVSTGTLIQIEM